MQRSRNRSMCVVMLGWAIALYATGVLPSFFSLCILLSGVSINRFVLFLVVEVSDDDAKASSRRVSISSSFHHTTLQCVRTTMAVWENIFWAHEMVKTSPFLPYISPLQFFYAGVAILTSHIFFTYGFQGIKCFLTLTAGFTMLFTYKYQVQTTRNKTTWKRRKIWSFFQHGCDYVVFGPMTFVLVVVFIKMLECRNYWTYPLVSRSASCPSDTNPMFRVEEGPHALNLSSIMGSVELTYANVGILLKSPCESKKRLLWKDYLTVHTAHILRRRWSTRTPA